MASNGSASMELSYLMIKLVHNLHQSTPKSVMDECQDLTLSSAYSRLMLSRPLFVASFRNTTGHLVCCVVDETLSSILEISEPSD